MNVGDQPKSRNYRSLLWLACLPFLLALVIMFAGKSPTNLGVRDNRLAACPQTPNCVCSYDADTQHAIAPLTYQSSPTAAWEKLQQVIAALDRTKVVSVTENYLYVQCSSKLMGFVDDVEFYLDPAAQAIQVRSASRLGQSDLGVNRNRIELIRAKLAELGA